MSTLRVDNFGPSAGGTTYSARGIAKSWINFDGTGTVSIRDSENVSSLTDNATGNYTVTFINSMLNTGYYFSGASETTTGSTNNASFAATNNSVLTSSIDATYEDVDGGYVDYPRATLIVAGDLA